MICNVIATGSSGNAVLLDGEILIDCGISWRALAPHAAGIRLVLLTHRHADHFRASTIKKLAFERPSVRFACCAWMAEQLVGAGVSKGRIDIAQCGVGIAYGAALECKPVEIPHDVPNCGWFVRHGERTAFYATDCGSLDGVEMPGIDLYMIEANHTEQDIQRRAQEKLDRGEYAYEYRAARNHLSMEQAMDWIGRNAGTSSRCILLHQHKDKDNARNSTTTQIQYN